MPLSFRPTALVFDVLGTVVDEDGTVIRASAALLAGSTARTPIATSRAEAEAFAQEWMARHSADLQAVVAGDRPWLSGDALRREALESTLTMHPEVRPTPEGLDEAANVGYRLDPWPDSVAAINRLADVYTVIALTNGGTEQTEAMSERAGINWTHVLTGDDARQFKPHPAMYRLPLDEYRLDPEVTLFVAAHPWDLDAAAEAGYRTALVLRPEVEAPADAYDLQVADLGALADALL
ncbi:haloacid dehalogenase type II [Frondihabitans cladoniiphilus]|uniref:Haloacid dehalogenase type II n=1 Tax=Frondihabitans cladoniiphilus TaxID=715785 RepID=A0ABP8WA33_9MICO